MKSQHAEDNLRVSENGKQISIQFYGPLWEIIDLFLRAT